MGINRAKRIMDVAVAATALAAVAPLMVLVAAFLRATVGRPVLSTQTRPGLHGEPFALRKFRTMREDRDAHGHLLPDEQRVTRFGRLLRSTSLDELPELLNVLRGDMSLVGPRPLLVEYLDRYSPEQARRHEVRPGITGLAQVEGRNALPWERKLALDVWYVDHRTLGLDVRLLMRTLVAVLTRRDISQEGHVGAAPFLGSLPDQDESGSYPS